MPVQFLTPKKQRANYGQYIGEPSFDELTRYFYLDDTDQAVSGSKRGDHNRLGFALQLTTVRVLGTFLENPVTVPSSIVQTLARQLGVLNLEGLADYRAGEQRWKHAAEIRERYGFRDWTDAVVGFRLSRWLYALCWTGTEQPRVLFDRATTWMLAHKVILPGATSLERFVARLRSRVERFHGKRGKLRQRYREGQEDQLGALGLVLNVIVLWNTIYMDAAIEQLRGEGFPVLHEDVARLSPFVHKHINMLGRYSFAVPDSVTRGELRPLRNPDEGP